MVSFFKKWLQRLLRLGSRSVLVGAFSCTCYNADGTVAWQVPVFFNGDTTAGLNDMLNAYFGGTSQTTTWYMSLVDNSGWTAFSTNDTSASHAGWSENQAYTATTRPTWTPTTASGGAITTSSNVSFTMNAGATLKGAFITSNNVKGGTSGLLFATAAFPSLQTVVNTQVLSFGYTKTLTPT